MLESKRQAPLLLFIDDLLSRKRTRTFAIEVLDEDTRRFLASSNRECESAKPVCRKYKERPWEL